MNVSYISKDCNVTKIFSEHNRNILEFHLSEIYWKAPNILQLGSMLQNLIN